MERINPYFTVGGKKYDIKRTRYLLCEYERLMEEGRITGEERASSIIFAQKTKEVQDIAEKYRAAKDAFFSDITNEKKKAEYMAYKSVYEDAYKDYVDYDSKSNSSQTVMKAMIDVLEKLVISALKEQYSFSEDEARAVWCKFVDENGNNYASEWLYAMQTELFAEEEEDEKSFLSIVKRKAAGK